VTSFLRRIILPSVACLALPYFSTLSHKWHDFRKNTEYMCNFIFCTPSVWNTSYFKKIQRDIIINVHRSSCKVPVLIKLEFSQQIFKKPSNIKFHANPFSGSRVVPCRVRRTDRHHEASSHFSQNWEKRPISLSLPSTSYTTDHSQLQIREDEMDRTCSKFVTG
jgi:hypothetical protein